MSAAAESTGESSPVFFVAVSQVEVEGLAFRKEIAGKFSKRLARGGSLS